MDEGDTVIVKVIRIATATMLQPLLPRRDRETDKGLILSLFPIAPNSSFKYNNGNKDGKCRTRQGRHETLGMMQQNLKSERALSIANTSHNTLEKGNRHHHNINYIHSFYSFVACVKSIDSLRRQQLLRIGWRIEYAVVYCQISQSLGARDTLVANRRFVDRTDQATFPQS